MIFLKAKLKRLRRESAPDAAFKAALRSRLVVDQPLIAYRFPVTAMRFAFATSALVLVFCFGLSSYAYASSAVTEGDTLYPVKTTIEDLEGSLKRSPEARARFRARMVDRRVREIAYRLNHDQPLTPAMVESLANVLNMSVGELQELKNDEAGRELAKTELKTKLTNSLTEFRTRVELSNLPEAQKAKYLRAIDLRLDAVGNIPTTANSD
jgi:hypothetical protein